MYLTVSLLKDLCSLLRWWVRVMQSSKKGFALFLEKRKIKLSDCRSQSYDNWSNMSGRYSRLHARFRERNPLADNIPCFAHSLNLVGHSAVDNISAASNFFQLVENVYFFFSASTHRWELLVNVLGGLPFVKYLNDTRWASYSDTSKALNCRMKK